MRHPSLSSPTRFVGRHLDVGEEHLGEVRGAADVAQRAHLDAGRVHVDDEQADALVLRRVGIGAHVHEALLRDHRVARPHLLAVDDEPIAVEHGTGLQARRGRSRRSARSCRCTRWCRRGSRRDELLLLVVAELEQARRDDRVAGEVQRARDATLRELLEVHERLHRRAVPPAELWRIARDHPAVIEERGLPVARPLGE